MLVRVAENAYLCSRFRNLWQDMQPANIASNVNILNQLFDNGFN